MAQSWIVYVIKFFYLLFWPKILKLNYISRNSDDGDDIIMHNI